MNLILAHICCPETLKGTRCDSISAVVATWLKMAKMDSILRPIFRIVLACSIIVRTCEPVGRSQWTFMDYFKFGKDAYLANDWRNCEENFNLALEDYTYHKSVVVRCKKLCRKQFENGTVSHDFNGIFERFVHETLCLMKCKREEFGPDRSDQIPAEVDKLFAGMEPYNYLQLCYFQQKKYREAADAAFTFHVKNPTNEMMLSNVHYYLDSPGVNKEEVVNLDKLSYTKLFMDGAQYYRDENYKMMIENMEQVIPLYLKHEEDCRFECEKPFDMGWFPDFITSIANHFTFCLRCKLRCISKLENLDGEVVEGLFPLLYHYLQMGYYKGGDVENAVKCVETYRLFHPNDADMNQNLEFYRDVEEAKAEWFEARHEAVAYLKRLTYEQSLLVRIEDTFAEFQPREESKALEQGISVEVDEFRPLPPPIPKFEL